VLEGNPGKRKLPNEVTPVTPLHKPAIVAESPSADAAWERAVSAMPPGFYTDADAAVLAIYAGAWALYTDALGTIAREGMFTTGSMGQIVAHPAIAIADKHAARILQASDRLGMSPVARARMGDIVPPALPPRDPDGDLLSG
jgi:P27 family predicted phage terminase small subunit